MIARADIAGSKSNGASEKAWLPMPSIGLGKIVPGWGGGRTKYRRKIDVIPVVTFLIPLGHAFTVCIHTENQNKLSFYLFVPHEISVLIELTLGHLYYCLTVPHQPNSQPDDVLDKDRPALTSLKSRTWTLRSASAPSNK